MGGQQQRTGAVAAVAIVIILVAIAIIVWTVRRTQKKPHLEGLPPGVSPTTYAPGETAPLPLPPTTGAPAPTS